MLIAETRLKASGERLVGQQRIEIHRCLGNTDTMALSGNAGMQVGQRLAVIQPTAFLHEAVEQREHAVGAVDEGSQNLVRVDT